jgi:hypothetical protein
VRGMAEYAKLLRRTGRPAEGARWLAMASGKGSVAATFDLAQMLERGEGVPAAPRQAATLYVMAAENGHRAVADRPRVRQGRPRAESGPRGGREGLQDGCSTTRTRWRTERESHATRRRQ